MNDPQKCMHTLINSFIQSFIYSFLYPFVQQRIRQQRWYTRVPRTAFPYHRGSGIGVEWGSIAELSRKVMLLKNGARKFGHVLQKTTRAEKGRRRGKKVGTSTVKERGEEPDYEGTVSHSKGLRLSTRKWFILGHNSGTLL